MTKTKSFESTNPAELETLFWKCAIKASRWFALVCLISILCAFNLHSVCAEELSHVWKASWITSPDAPLRDECVLLFKKEIEITSQPSRFVIHVSADNQYLLKVNGKYVGTGPSHSDIQHWKYTTYDIASLLHPGKNMITTARLRTPRASFSLRELALGISRVVLAKDLPPAQVRRCVKL